MMMLSMLVTAVALQATTPPPTPQPLSLPPPSVMPGWMAGCWIERKDDRATEECWTVAQAGSMLGSGRTMRGDRLVMWEAMQIFHEPGGIVFWAAPRGESRTRFTLGEVTPTSITFINAGNDYPQRIRYARDDAALVAEISLADGSRAMRWRFERR